MEPESSIPYTQVPATSPYPAPTPSSSNNPSQLPKIHLNDNILYNRQTLKKDENTIITASAIF